MTQILPDRYGPIEMYAVSPIQVRVVRPHRLKVPGFFEKAEGLAFVVKIKRVGGYDVDMAPLGCPGEWGFLYDSEVEEMATFKPGDLVQAIRMPRRHIGVEYATTVPGRIAVVKAASHTDPFSGPQYQVDFEPLTGQQRGTSIFPLHNHNLILSELAQS